MQIARTMASKVPTPPSTSSSNVGHSPETMDNQFKVIRKRNRVPLSCSSCRTRKLKCDRKNPCDNCTKRGDAVQCTYATAPSMRKRSSAASQSSSAPDEMQNRIDRLENLVLNLMTNGQGSAGPAAAVQAVNSTQSPISTRSTLDNGLVTEDNENGSDTESVTNSFGVLKVDNVRHKSLYIGENHWHMILANIAEVKNYFQKHEREILNQYDLVTKTNAATSGGGPPALFSALPPISELELRAALPSRPSIEKLTNSFFNSREASAIVLHWPTYHKQLSEHFSDPSRTTLTQLAVFYAVLALAMQTYGQQEEEPLEWKGRSFQLAAEFRLRTAQCLVMSDYTNPVDYTIEALCLYVMAEHHSRVDADMPIWTLIGIAMRLSMRMGYHRDPRAFPGLTPFKAEIRRRLWGMLRMADILLSYSLGLPSMMGNRDCDTSLPGNFYEDDLSEDMKELPPVRPDNEVTLCSSYIAKLRLCDIFGQIVEQVHSIHEHVRYDEIMRMDNKLVEVQKSLPFHLQLRPLEDSMHDSEVSLIERYALDLLYQKAVCVLHRKYLTRARTNPKYAHSRRACVNAGMQLLSHQAVLHRESQIGGRLRSGLKTMSNWAIGRLTKQDYLLGAVIVALDLYTDAMTKPFDSDRFFWTEEQKQNMYRALETSEAICSLVANRSIEAFKASKILRVMLEKIRSVKEGTNQQSPMPQQQQTSSMTGAPYPTFDTSQPEHSAAMTLGMLSSGGLTPSTAAMFATAAQSVDVGSQGDMTMPDATMVSNGVTPYMFNPNDGDMMNFQDPFNQVFGGVNSMSSYAEVPNTLNWDAWDSYVQYAPGNVDPTSQFQFSYPPIGDMNVNVNDPYANNMFAKEGGAGGGSI